VLKSTGVREKFLAIPAMRIWGADVACSPNLRITYFLTSVPIFPTDTIIFYMWQKSLAPFRPCVSGSVAN
jgi:hypothetical protein